MTKYHLDHPDVRAAVARHNQLESMTCAQLKEISGLKTGFMGGRPAKDDHIVIIMWEQFGDDLFDFFYANLKDLLD